MRACVRFCVTAFAVVCFSCLSGGCQTSSHKSIRTYEYSDEPHPVRSTDDELTSEPQMQSPGEMVSPGEMAPPGQMVDDE